MTEVRYAMEPVPGAGRVRVLYADGRWLVPIDERPGDWRERERPKQDAAPKPKPAPFHALSLRVKPVKAAPPKPPLPASARGQTTYRADITPDLILALTRERKRLDEIAGQFGVCLATVAKRIEKAKLDPAFAEAYKILQTCACGRKKWAHLPHCGECTTRATLAARKAASGRKIVIAGERVS